MSTNVVRSVAASVARAGLAGQKVVVIGGSSGIGLETARQARSESADVIVAGRDPERVERAARELGALSSAAFDATDFARLERFFEALPTPIDHVLVTGPAPTMGHWRSSTLTRRGETWRPTFSCQSRWLAWPRKRFAREGLCSS